MMLVPANYKKGFVTHFLTCCF